MLCAVHYTGKAAGSQKPLPVAAGGREKDGGWHAVFEGTLDLVIRMEKDRQETLHKIRRCSSSQVFPGCFCASHKYTHTLHVYIRTYMYKYIGAYMYTLCIL